MRLTAFRVQNYKTIWDSGRIKIRHDVTCLLGQNEAGKSAILQALWKSRNVAGAKFDLLYDYPKEGYAQAVAENANPVATVLEYTLDEADIGAFSEDFDIPAPTGLQFTTRYDGKAELALLGPDEANGLPSATKVESIAGPAFGVARAALDSLLALAAAPQDGQPDQVAGSRQQLTSLKNALSAATVNGDQVRAAAKSAVPTCRGQANALGSEAIGLLDRLSELEDFVTEAEFRQRLQKWGTDRQPAFIYFDEYGVLDTRIHLPEHVRLANGKTNDLKVRTRMALFEWAKINPQKILELGRSKQNEEPQEAVDRRKEERATLLESASFGLTGDWTQWWPQSREHRIRFSADGDDLVLKVYDNKNPWSVDFRERSRGFQWFFSFYLTFLVESKRAHQGAVLLLDEPGLHLHITAQNKLLAFFQRVAKDNQILYTSHSPFMVDPGHLDNVRTVFLKQAEDTGRMYTKVSATTEPEGDRDTMLPLQAALGYELAQTLFIGKRTLIVEGITDYWILKSLSHELAVRKRQALPEDVVVLFAGGTSHILPLVSMFARPDEDGRRLVVLLDGDKAGLNKATTLKRDLLHRDGAVAVMSDPDLLGKPEVEVEDIVDRDELLASVEALKGGKVKRGAAGKASTNVPALKALYVENGWPEFSHQDKATLLLALVDTWRSGKAPSEATLSNAERVVRGLSERLGGARG